MVFYTHILDAWHLFVEASYNQLWPWSKYNNIEGRNIMCLANAAFFFTNFFINVNILLQKIWTKKKNYFGRMFQMTDTHLYIWDSIVYSSNKIHPIVHTRALVQLLIDRQNIHTYLQLTQNKLLKGNVNGR